MAEEMRNLPPHTVVLRERREMTVTGVRDVDSFDEETIVAFTDLGTLTIKGVGLHINKIDVESGDPDLEGEIYLLSYADDQPARGGFFARLLR